MTALILLSEWQKSQIEFWKPIDGFADCDVSTFGRIRSRRGKNGHSISIPRIVGQSIRKTGYRTITLGNKNNRKGQFIHRLVLKAFRGLPPEGKDKVNHRNGCKADCRLDNLEWCTQQENVSHCYTHLDPRILRGEEVGDSKFKESDIRQMRQWFTAGLSQSEIGRRFGVPQGTIWRIVVKPYQAWKHVD